MTEANTLKYFLAKYFLLAISLIQWLVGSLILLRYGTADKFIFISLIFFTIGLVFLFSFIIVKRRIKRVAVGTEKIVIIDGVRRIKFPWQKVKSIKIIPLINIYRIKIKGKKNSIYFFPTHNIDYVFGLKTKDTSKMAEIIKRKKQFGN